MTCRCGFRRLPGGIFIHASGYRMDDVLREVGSSANYWSSTADTEYPDYAWYLFAQKDRYVGEYGSARYYGHSVRPVYGRVTSLFVIR